MASSTKMTAVRIPRTKGYLARGHVTRQEAITEAKAHYMRQLNEARHALACIDTGEVTVYHQQGIWSVSGQVEVKE